VIVAGGTTLAPSDYPFTITASGNSLSSSTPLTLRVSNFTASLNKTTGTLTGSQPANFTVTLTSLNHFSNSNISISCQSTANVTCTPAQAYTSLSDGATAAAALQIAYTGTARNERRDFRRRPPVALACIALALLPLARHYRMRGRYFKALSLLLACLASVAGLASCGGGSQGGGPPPSNQTVQVTVNASAQVSSGILQQPAGVITLTLAQ
jgi:hypothetical protein